MKSINKRKWLFRLLGLPILFIAISLFTLVSVCVPPFEPLTSTLPLTTSVTQASEYSFEDFRAASQHYIHNHIPLLMRTGNGSWSRTAIYRCDVVDCELIDASIDIGVEPPIQCFRNEWNSHTVTFGFDIERNLVEIHTFSSRLPTVYPIDSISMDEVMQVAFKTIDQALFNDYPSINIDIHPAQGDIWSAYIRDLNDNVLLHRRIDYEGNLVQ